MAISSVVLLCANFLPLIILPFVLFNSVSIVFQFNLFVLTFLHLLHPLT